MSAKPAAAAAPQPLRPVTVVAQGKPGPTTPQAAGPLKPVQPQPLKPQQQTAPQPSPQPLKPAQPTGGTLLKPGTAGPASTPSSAVTSPVAKPQTERSKSSSHSQPAAMAMSPQHHQRMVKDGDKEKSSDKPSASSSSSASGSKTARPNLLEQRQEQNRKDLPLNVKMMLQKRPEMWSDPQFAHNYPVEVWEHYDVNKDGILNKSELLALAKDLVDRIVSMCKDGLRAQMPKSSESDLDKMIKKEMAHILPAKTVEESRRVIAEHIFRELDIDKDGVITRTEFFFNWQSCSQKVLDVNKTKQEALSCTIL